MISHIAIVLLLLVSTSVYAGTPPKQLRKVVDHFLNMDSTSLVIHQVIDWRFSNKVDSVSFRIDIRGGRNFHIDLAAFGLELFVTESEIMTLNHTRAQVLYENSTPDALLKQIFVGGDLNNVRYRGEKDLENELRRLDFTFDVDYSDWDKLSVILDPDDDLQKIILVDYDGNKYLITFTYLPEFKDYSRPDLARDYPQYQIADMRK